LISPVDNWVVEETGLGKDLTPDSLLSWQMDRVREQIRYARDRGQFYGSLLAGFDVDSIRSLGDLSRIPFTKAEDLRNQPTSFLCVSQSDVSRVTTLSTSGSSGERKRVFFTRNDLERTVGFFAYGMSTMVQRGDRVTILMSTKAPDGIGDLLQRGLSRIGVSSTIHGNVKDVSSALDAAADADCLVGVPAEINYLSRTDRSLRPKAVLLSGDYVPESIIRNIEASWGAQVYTHYGMTETGFGGGVQCDARDGYHLRHPDFLIEIIDPVRGTQAPHGEVGEVVLTTLRNEAMPLIRYRTGDVARMLEPHCPCGGILPRLDKVLGRMGGVIEPLRWDELAINRLDETMFSIPHVRNYRVELAQRWMLSVDSSEKIDEGTLRQAATSVLGCDLPIEIRFEAVPPFQGTGKRGISLLTSSSVS
jgi:phenylacetate-CoA ligase